MQIEGTENIIGDSQLTNPHKWVDKYADYLYTYAVIRLNDHDLASDLVQETFLAALEKLEKFEGRSSEKTWLIAILKNKIIDVYRKKASGLIKTPLENIASPADDDFFYEDRGNWKVEHWPRAFGIEDHDPLSSKELNNILQQCMKKLPSLWLSVFTMKHVDDEKTDLICKELRVSQANFWVIIHRAKLQLRACLQKNWI